VSEQKSLIAIVDRIVGDKAVLEFVESRYTFDFPVELLPEVHEGAALKIDFELRPDIEEERRERVRDLQDRLIQRSKEEEE